MLGTFPVEGWFDCGTLESLLETNRHLLEGALVPGHLEDSVVIPPVYVAASAQRWPDAQDSASGIRFRGCRRSSRSTRERCWDD